ncbi:hypothetical protein BH11VER1_BH11VER1_34470 [soil metagenome]
MTIIELSLVIALIMMLAAVFFGLVFPLADWKKAKDAGISLQAVYTAQKTYLADHPTQNIATVTAAQLIPYLPNNMTAIPTAVSIAGGPLTIDFSVIPPVVTESGALYDPSGKSNDGLWDAGKL